MRLAAKLEAVGLYVVGDLLRVPSDSIHAATAEIASIEQARRWRQMALFLEIPVMNPQWAEALVSGGVGTLADLASTDFNHLVSDFDQVKAARKIAAAPDAAAIASMMAAATALANSAAVMGTVTDAGLLSSRRSSSTVGTHGCHHRCTRPIQDFTAAVAAEAAGCRDGIRITEVRAGCWRRRRRTSPSCSPSRSRAELRCLSAFTVGWTTPPQGLQCFPDHCRRGDARRNTTGRSAQGDSVLCRWQAREAHLEVTRLR